MPWVSQKDFDAEDRLDRRRRGRLRLIGAIALWLLGASMLAVALGLVLAACDEADQRRRCEERGGLLVSAPLTPPVCVRRDAVIEPER